MKSTILILISIILLSAACAGAAEIPVLPAQVVNVSGNQSAVLQSQVAPPQVLNTPVPLPASSLVQVIPSNQTGSPAPGASPGNTTQGELTNGTPAQPAALADPPSYTESDQQFLFLMNQYWIPDLYDIKGRVDCAAGFGSDLPQILNLSAEYARIRISRNINETEGYSLSPEVSQLKRDYQTGARKCGGIVDEILRLNRTSEGFAENVSMRSAAFSLYGTWLEYQVMRCYDLPNMTYPEIATVPPDSFMQIMGVITP